MSIASSPVDRDRRELLEELARDRVGWRPSVSVPFRARLTSPVCGDDYEVGLVVDGGRIVAVERSGDGCGISAAASALTLTAAKLTSTEVRALAERHLGSLGSAVAVPEDRYVLAAFAGFGRSPMRLACAALPWRAGLVALDRLDLAQADGPGG